MIIRIEKILINSLMILQDYQLIKFWCFTMIQYGRIDENMESRRLKAYILNSRN